MTINNTDKSQTAADSDLSMSAGSRAMEWARNNTAWRLLEDGRICVRPKDLMAVVDECNRYRKALEEIASNESAVNAERADGIAITALAFENRENTRRNEA